VISDFDGMSGSPVFLFKEINNKQYLVNIEGMLIRARYYLDFVVIAGLIKKAQSKGDIK
jgi:hypothetical protein